MSERIGITRNGNTAFSIDLPDDGREFEFVVRKSTEVERFIFRIADDGTLQLCCERLAGGGASHASAEWSTGVGSSGGAGSFPATYVGGGAGGGGGFPINKSSIKYVD
ncbi:hypothetical protein [Burkholderia gladioli]|uniref:hypothetical protein n=1 Tax=Burkholderia gladioli TaxID=28095 RepID=UPI0016403500|nr:hypothetical protein [Burkholderia gladioli]